jgi:hypothetical protein
MSRSAEGQQKLVSSWSRPAGACGRQGDCHESTKLVTAGWPARRRSATAAVWRAGLVVFVFGLAIIGAAGVYAQLASAPVGERGAVQRY